MCVCVCVCPCRCVCYMCMCACMYACVCYMYVCACVCACTCVYVICMCVYVICMCVHVRVHACACVCVICMCVHVYLPVWRTEVSTECLSPRVSTLDFEAESISSPAFQLTGWPTILGHPPLSNSPTLGLQGMPPHPAFM